MDGVLDVDEVLIINALEAYPFLLFTAQLATLATCCIAETISSLGHCGAQKSTRHLGPPPCWPLWFQLLHRLPRCAEIEQMLFALYTLQHLPLSKLLVNRVLLAVSRTAWALLEKWRDERELNQH